MKHLPAIYGYATDVQGEGRRLDEFSEMQVLDDLSAERIDQYTNLVAETLEVPIAITQLFGRDKVWLNSESSSRTCEAEREFLQLVQVVKADRFFVVDNVSADPILASHAAVCRKDGVRFCAGKTLLGPNGDILGVACALDHKDRNLTTAQVEFLKRILLLIERELQGQEILAEVRENIRERVLRDPITDLPYLSLFHEQLNYRCHSKGRNEMQCLVAAIRLTRYDMLENAIGRSGAGYLIGKAVDRMNSRTDHGILVGQVREDEIVVSQSCPARSGSWEDLLETIIGCFKEPFSFGDDSFVIAAEVGASRYPVDADNSVDLVRKARIALRTSSGIETTGGYRIFSASFSTRSDDQFRLESALTKGLSKGEFYVVYQPIISLGTGSISGAEALVRWNSAELGEVSPSDFIPHADRIGLLSEIGDFVSSTVCGHLSEWKSSELSQITISLNVSNSQLREPQFANRLIHLIERSRVDGSRLRLEITEGTLIDEPLQVIEIMEVLRKTSISFSIDDFGTGFSSLNYLRMMPLSGLKIDRSFITDIPDNNDNLIIANSIIALGHGLGLTIVAEGVENLEQLEWLRKQGCDEVQGYFYSKPLPVEQFEQLASRKSVFLDRAERRPRRIG